ncbi:MAG: permease-like cell division protein FtsX [Clostridia bacterium]|nr:permease-like cell division protein FtsX [Oscillospiraceae bacterium]MBQ1955075.1 permease-like cell division protein FtsX [Clostridia bacterium]
MKGLAYHLRESLASLVRNRLVNTGAVGLLITCLVMTGAFAMFMTNINLMVDEIGAVNEVSVYIDENAPDGTAAEVEEEIKKVGNVASVKFVSKEEALESLRDDFGDLLDGLEEDNPLRDGFVIELSDQEFIEDTVSTLGKIKGVAKISYNGDVASKFVNVRNFVAMLGVGVIVVLGVVSVLIVTYSVRISVYTKREEIEIMKIVGATNMFVRAPFIFEGIILGIIGAAVSYGIVVLVYMKVFVPGIERLNFVSALPFSEFALPLVIIYVAAGVLMGLFGGTFAINRYLKH